MAEPQQPAQRRTFTVPPTPAGTVPGFGPAEPILNTLGLEPFAALVKQGTAKALETIAEDTQNPQIQLLGTGLLTSGAVAGPALGLPGLTLGTAIKGMGLAAPAILGAIKTQGHLGAPYFYSRLEQALERMPQHAQTPQAIEKYLRGSVNPQEMDYRGVTELLQAARADRDQRILPQTLKVQTTLNPVTVQQHAYGVEPDRSVVDAWRAQRDALQAAYAQTEQALRDNRDRAAALRKGLQDALVREPQRFGLPEGAMDPYVWQQADGSWSAEYVMPTHPNRPVELHHIPATAFDQAILQKQEQALAQFVPLEEARMRASQELTAWEQKAPEVPTARPTQFEQYTTPGGQNYREFVLNVAPEGGFGSQAFYGGHFGVPNEFVHVRAQDFQAPDGKRVLLIDEIQSDWNEKVRKYGTASPQMYQQLDQAAHDWGQVRNATEALITQSNLLRRRGQEIPEGLQKEITQARDAEQAAYENWIRLKDRTRETAPDLPFKQMEWAKLAFKRMLAEAAEEGFDRLSWTTGGQQADRWAGAENTQFLKNLYDTDFVNIANKLVKPFGGRVTQTPLVVKGGHPRFIMDGPPMTAQELEQIAQSVWRTQGEYSPEGRVLANMILDVQNNVPWDEVVRLNGSLGLARRLGREARWAVPEKTVMMHTIELSPQMREAMKKTGFPLLQVAPAVGLAGALATRQQQTTTQGAP